MSKPRTSAGPRPADLVPSRDALIVLDVDEVVLEFIRPFSALLEEQGARLHPESFKLTGNVRSIATGTALTGHELDRATERLYATQRERQKPVEGVRPSLARLGSRADILFLTAMTPAFYEQRRALLDEHGLTHPMIATERSKGAVVAELMERWAGPVVFVDDLPPNLESVRRSAENAHLIHLMANAEFRPHLPPLPPGAESATDWSHAVGIIEALLRAE